MPLYLVLVGIVSGIMYSIGQYGRSRYKEAIKIVGVAGVGFVMLKAFWTGCPLSGVSIVLMLLGITLISSFAVWLYYKIKDNNENTKTRYDGLNQNISGD